MKARLPLRAGPAQIFIAGKTYPQALAVIIFRCAECLGELRYHNHGLACVADVAHKGFIHRDEARRVAAQRAEQLEQVAAVYEIRDGRVTSKEELI